jgi:very-short-patch-repair endonuclease
MSSSLAIAFIALVIVAALGLVMKKTKRSTISDNDEWPFYARKPLSAPEQVLYFRLCRALPEHIILAQVQLSRLLGVKKGHNFQAWSNRINRLTADFVVCTKDASAVAVIELDDSSHERQGRRDTDAKKDKALRSAGIRVIRWRVNNLPDDAEIVSKVAAESIVR